MNLDSFKEQDKFYQGLQTFFNSLNIPVNYIDENPLRPQDILSKTYKDTNRAYQLMGDVYILGMVDDKAFSNSKSEDIFEIKKQKNGYDGILIFGVTLTDRKKGLLPTRTQLAEITRAFNREFYYTPVVVVFRYADFLSLANAERQKYKQEWREGEKAGKVSILRDIEIENPHAGHLKILEELKITRSGKKGINSFEGLYQYWQEVFSVNLLNKKFYTELSNWYFWAVKHVTFPSEPTIYSLFAETGSNDNNKLEVVKQEFKAKNVIRLLTRLLFVWFIKEKKLIPEDLFNLEILQKNILKKISPFHEKDSLFKEANKESIYYKAILQNLFFATLNCPVKPDSVDTRERGFRGDESYGKHRGIDYLMRYKKYFKDPDAFLEMVNKVVPFLNGGLFECLDDKDKKIYIDGFSDNMSKTDGVANHLIVPDYLFFGSEEKTDLSSDYGTKNKGTKEAEVQGLINILKSYKFTIAENTPIEEDVALDPELLGKVFENLLASYNPETKTTARKQTGSFYTPREIVNYMVDESLIAHLKNSISSWDMEEQELDEKLHKLLSFEPVNPFEHSPGLAQEIIHSLDNCKILDPACGSGAFPMGILQKMVHILQKVDPDNEYWQELQLEKAQKATEGVFVIKNKEERKLLLDEINEAFDETINNPDYARKLFLIENCIYGVDIQPIATQISKLRFFISLVVEQKVKKGIDNFGIRPLPNLETKFVTANTLIGIDKPDGELFYTKEVQEKEAELKTIRHKLFGAKTKATKMKYRKKDEELRNEIADILKKGNLPVESAEQLATWDPYDQNGVSPFFDPEWMFDVKNGFDVVIGNPPYKLIGGDAPAEQILFKKSYQMASYKINTYVLFLEKGLSLLKCNDALVSYIIPKSLVFNTYLKQARGILLSKFAITKVIEIIGRVFENAEVGNNIIFFAATNKNPKDNHLAYHVVENVDPMVLVENYCNQQRLLIERYNSNFHNKLLITFEFKKTLKDVADIANGLNPGNVRHILLSSSKDSDKHKKMLLGKNIQRYKLEWSGTWVNYDINLKKTISLSEVKSKKGMTAQKKVDFALRKEKIFYSNKILVRKTSDHIIASYDPLGFCFDSLAYGIHLKEGIKLSIFYLLGVLNSKYIQYIHESISLNKGKVFAKVLLKNLANLPIYDIDFNNNFEKSIHYNIVQLVRMVCEISGLQNNNIIKTLFEQVVDGLVFQLHFPDHMKKQKIDILQFVEKDIERVIQGKGFEVLNGTQKEQVIKELYSRWSEPDNEIVKRMNSFSEKSPEILKPILEG